MTTPPLDLPGLRDRIVLVTGSSRGIGEGLVRAFARCGAACVVNYVNDPQGRNRADAERVAAETAAALTVECDVADYDAVGRMMDRVQQSLGGLDVLVNNAGVIRDRSLKKMTPQDWQAVLQVNLTGTFNCLQHATRVLRPQGASSIFHRSAASSGSSARPTIRPARRGFSPSRKSPPASSPRTASPSTPSPPASSIPT